MKGRNWLAFIVIFSLAIGLAGHTDAQFWKKKSKRHSRKHQKSEATAVADTTATAGKEPIKVKEPKKSKAEKRKEKKERKKKEKEARKALKKEGKKSKKKGKGTTAETPAAKPGQHAEVIRKWSDLEYPVSARKSHYRIDVLAQMYLDELVKNGYPVKKIPEKAVPGLDFYKGIQIAADTLKKAGFDIDIYVHDVASILESSDMLANKNMMDSTDLIIGAVAPRDIPTLAAYAKRKQINFVSTLANTDGNVKDNIYFTTLCPSTDKVAAWIKTEIAAQHPAGKSLLIYRPLNAAESFWGPLMLQGTGKEIFKPLAANQVPGADVLRANMDTSGVLSLCIATTDTKYIDSLFRVLKRTFPQKHVEIYGLPEWSAAVEAGKWGVYPSCSIHLPGTFNAGTETAAYKYIADVFQAEYGGAPTEYVSAGYETLFWYANLLKRYGTIFNKHYNDNETAPFTKFDVTPRWDDKTGNVIYFENHLLVKKQFFKHP